MKGKTGRRIFITSCGTFVVAVLSGIWKLEHYINDFKEGNIISDKNKPAEKKNPLFNHYPSLSSHVPWISLGEFPTPIEDLGSAFGLDSGRLIVKRDDVSSLLYGGNKVRKLEYLLAEAKMLGCDTIITIGSIGSNHALTTAILGNNLGFDVELCLFHQPLSGHVIENMKGFLGANAKLHYDKKMTGAYNRARIRYNKLKELGYHPYFIVSGGTCGLGNLGYCGAVLELKAQLEEQNIAFPDAIFVPVGTCGTIAGILAGMKLTGMKAKVFGVKIYDSFPANSFMIKYYAQHVLETIQKYCKVDQGRINDNQLILLKDYLGRGYGYPTAKSKQMVKLAEPVLHLENTYTGKTLAACIDYCKSAGQGEKILFWDTYNSQTFRKSENLLNLPEPLSAFIENANWSN